MRAEIVEDETRLYEHAAQWQQLVDAVEDGLFLSWDWIDAWWRAYAGVLSGRLHVVVVRGGDGAVEGIAPLYVAGAVSLARVLRPTTLRFLGAGGDTSPDYLNVLARPGREEEVAACVAQALAERTGSWNALHLTDLADDAPMTAAFEQALQERLGWTDPLRRVPRAVCPYVALAHSPEALLARAPAKLRYNVRSRWKKLARDHSARFFLWDGPAAEGISRIAELHRRRFQAKGDAHSFATERYVAFHQDVAARFARRGALRLYCLEAEGQLVAMLYCFRQGERVYHFQSGFDPDWRHAGVGQVLVARALEHACGEGVRRFDFLKGEYAYKDDWATGRRRTSTLTAGRLGTRGMLHLYETVWRPAVGELARRALR